MSRKKLIFILLRGGMDGLHAVPPNPLEQITPYRPSIKASDYVALNDKFLIHKKLRFFHHLYSAKKMSVLHACGMPNNSRSHFKAQDYIESGLQTSSKLTGWLARILQHFDPGLKAVAYDTSLPVMLTGHKPAFNWTNQRIGRSVSSYLSTMDASLYGEHPELASALSQLKELSRTSHSEDTDQLSPRLRPFSALAKMMRDPSGPQIGFYASGNWDMHDRLNRRADAAFTLLDRGLKILCEDLKAEFNNTVIVVFSEFGRSVRENGTGGTDHGTGGLAFIGGGSYQGGEMLGQWPGIQADQLYEDRDLMPVNDIRDLFLEAVHTQFGWDERQMKRLAFPKHKPKSRGLFA